MKKLNPCKDLLSEARDVLGSEDEPARYLLVHEANRLLQIVERALKCEEPCLHSYFEERQKHCPLLDTGLEMARSGWHDAAHKLLYLRYDQILKEERSSQERLHKGAVLCNLAILQQVIGSSSGVHHYASLAVIGDVLWEPFHPDLRDGGLASQLLAQFESRTEIEKWREALREQYNADEGVKKPAYVEAGLTTRWFSETRANHILNLRRIRQQGPVHFSDLLLHRALDESLTSDERGLFFEAAVGLILSATPGFDVRHAFTEPDEQVDLLVHYKSEPDALLQLPDGYGLVECRARREPVGAPDLRDFGAKCFVHGVRYGIIAAGSGITGKGKYTAAQLTRRKFFNQGIVLLVVGQDELQKSPLVRRGLASALRDDYERLAFGEPSYGRSPRKS